jgi:hypothetical protein
MRAAATVAAAMTKPIGRTLAAGVLVALVLIGSGSLAAGPVATNAEDIVPGATSGNATEASQPTFPIRAAFFYPWFPQVWAGDGQAGGRTNYGPTLGYYSSQDAATIDRQLELAAGAHLQAFIASWWGPGHHTDLALQHILPRSARVGSPAPELRWAIYYEAEGQGDPTVSQLVADLQYLSGTLFAQPAYLRVDGKPVVFVYADARDGAGMADRWAQAKAQLGGSVYVVLKVYAGYRADPHQPDSWHQYAPAINYDAQMPYAVTVSPGFWKVGEPPRLGRDPARFEADVQKMAASGAVWQLITTWNEWGEGTAVEPAAEFGSTYLGILCRNLPLPLGGDCAALDAAAPLPALPEPAVDAAPESPRSAPESPLPAAGSVVIAAAGDIACGAESTRASCRQMDTSDLLLQLNPDAILALGDTQYEKGGYADFVASWGSSWGRLKDRVHPAVGNHEYLTAGAAGYFDFFNGPGAPTGPAGVRDKGYYSFDLGAWHLVAANSNCSKVGGCGSGSPQEQWLRADLAAHPTACSLMFMHHPLWSSDSREFETTELRPLVQAFYDYGGELVLVGHSHFYERYAPQDADGNLDPARGVREIIVGTGGRNVYGVGRIRPNSEARDGRTFGVLKVTLDPTSFSWAFVPLPNQTFTDSGTQACH